MNFLKHFLHSSKPAVLVGKTYRPYFDTNPDKLEFGVRYDEITQFVFSCSYCGYTWKETLRGKEVDIPLNK